MKLHLVQAKDEDWGLKLASGTDRETEEPEDGWGGFTPLYEVQICGKASCALVLYTKKVGPHCAHFEAILLALHTLQGFRKILFLVIITITQARC